MAVKELVDRELGKVRLYKRHGSRHIRLSVSPKGYVRVTMPLWVPYKTGLAFAQKQADWVRRHAASTPEILITDNSRIGKSYRVVFKAGPSVRAQLKNGQVLVKSPYPLNDSRSQAKARQGAELALQKEADKLFPQQLAYLAKKHDFSYSQLKIRKMTSRWGSCSSKKVITLSSYLVQLPWDLIDYVMVHELLHTRHMHHGPKFWADFEAIIPKAKKLRKQVNEHKPRLVIN